MEEKKPVIEWTNNTLLIKGSGKESHKHWISFTMEVVCRILEGKSAVVVTSVDDLQNPFGKFSDQVTIWRTEDVKYCMAVCKSWSHDDIKSALEDGRFFISETWFHILNGTEWENIVSYRPKEFIELTGDLTVREDANTTIECLGCLADGDWVAWFNPSCNAQKIIENVYTLYQNLDDPEDDSCHETAKTCLLF